MHKLLMICPTGQPGRVNPYGDATVKDKKVYAIYVTSGVKRAGWRSFSIGGVFCSNRGLG